MHDFRVEGQRQHAMSLGYIFPASDRWPRSDRLSDRTVAASAGGRSQHLMSLGYILAAWERWKMRSMIGVDCRRCVYGSAVVM